MERHEPEIEAVASRLRQERPHLEPAELDGLKARVSSRIVRAPAGRAGPLRSRVALTAILATGILMSGTGATLAVTGIAGDGDAATSQYIAPGTDDTQKPSSTDDGDVLGKQKKNDCPSVSSSQNGPRAQAACPGDADDDGDTAGRQGQGETQSVARVNDQVAASGTDSRLPFTGLAVFPLLLGGVALLCVGGVLRRQSRAL